MNRLSAIIGLAPSEIPFEECLVRVQTERTRVREALVRFRAAPPAKTRKPPKKKRHAELNKLLTEFNLTPEELSALIKEGK